MLACDVVCDDPGGFELTRCGCFSAVLRGKDPLKHVVVTDGLRRMRLDLRGGTVTRLPVRLRFTFDGLRVMEAPLLTLQRLAAFDRRGAMPLVLFVSARRFGRGSHLSALTTPGILAQARGWSHSSIRD